MNLFEKINLPQLVEAKMDDKVSKTSEIIFVDFLKFFFKCLKD